MIQALVDHRRLSSVLVSGSWMMPRLPVNMPRASETQIFAEGIDAVLQRHVSHAPRKCVAAARQSQSKFCARCSTTCIFLRTLYPAPCLNVPGLLPSSFQKNIGNQSVTRGVYISTVKLQEI